MFPGSLAATAQCARSRHIEVVLERKRNMSFCLNVLLCLATGFLWMIYWGLRARYPKSLRLHRLNASS